MLSINKSLSLVFAPQQYFSLFLKVDVESRGLVLEGKDLSVTFF